MVKEKYKFDRLIYSGWREEQGLFRYHTLVCDGREFGIPETWAESLCTPLGKEISDVGDITEKDLDFLCMVSPDILKKIDMVKINGEWWVYE